MRTRRPCFPQWPYGEPIQRKLAYLEGNSLYDESGNRFTFSNHCELADLLYQHNLLSFTDSLSTQANEPLLRGACADGRCTVLCDKYGKPAFIIFRRGGRGGGTRWITLFDRFGCEASAESLSYLRGAFDYMGVGTYPTPASLGRQTQLAVYDLNGLSRHTSPSLAAEEFLQHHAIGGIVHTPGRGNHYARLLQLDMASAYLSQYTYHPDGSAYYFRGRGDHMAHYATYFARCHIKVTRPLPLGPFPIRTFNHRQGVRYPTETGDYIAYLWKEQVEDARQAGCTVDIDYGYGWNRFTSDNGAWAAFAYYLRKQSPKAIEPVCKLLANGAMGKFASSRIHYTLSTKPSIKPSKRPLILEHEPINLYIHASEDHNQYVNLAWYYYTIMRTNREVYYFALPFALQNRLIAMDYDSITVLEENERGRFLRKKSPPTFHAPPGHWTWEPIYDVHILANRQMVWKDENGTWQRKIPGMKKKGWNISDMDLAA